eukprot:COSAG02_NODE_2980_length_7625_cov_21.004651_1_plen_217_part_00
MCPGGPWSALHLSVSSILLHKNQRVGRIRRASYGQLPENGSVPLFDDRLESQLFLAHYSRNWCCFSLRGVMNSNPSDPTCDRRWSRIPLLPSWCWACCPRGAGLAALVVLGLLLAALVVLGLLLAALVVLGLLPSCPRALVVLGLLPSCPRALVVLGLLPECPRALVVLGLLPECPRALVVLGLLSQCVYTLPSWCWACCRSVNTRVHAGLVVFSA